MQNPHQIELLALLERARALAAKYPTLLSSELVTMVKETLEAADKAAEGRDELIYTCDRRPPFGAGVGCED